MKINEKSFQRAVIELAGFTGWRIYHPVPAMNARGGWRTAQEGHVGFPDLVLAKAGPTGGLIFAELKTAVGRVSPDQRLWLDTLEQAGAEVYVWRPTDIATIRTRLMKGISHE